MIEDFELLETIATSSQSTIHRARDRRSDEIFALKIYTESYQETAWKRETEALSQLQSAHIIKLVETGQYSAGAYLALEWLGGGTLESQIACKPLPPKDFTRLVSEALSALTATHEAGYLHRDVKPENLMQSQSGIWKLIDFGEARPFHQATQQVMTGSVHFMAPEQFGKATLTASTDLYSIGCTFFQALTGHYLHDGDSSAQVIASHLHPDNLQLEARIPQSYIQLIPWLRSLVSKQPADRPSSAAQALKAFQSLNFDTHS